MGTDPTRSIAASLARRGVALPARVLVEAHRPLAPLLTDVAAALGPLASVLGGRRAGAAMAEFDDPAAMDRLARALENAEQGADGEPG